MGRPLGPIRAQHLARALQLDVLEEVILHHRHRRRAAAGEAFDEFNAVFAAGFLRLRGCAGSMSWPCRLTPAAVSSLSIN